MSAYNNMKVSFLLFLNWYTKLINTIENKFKMQTFKFSLPIESIVCNSMAVYREKEM